MGTSTVRPLTAAEIAATQVTIATGSLVGAGTGKTTAFRFVANFDGTNNDKNNLDLSGSKLQTNVANFFDQSDTGATGNTNQRSAYYKGVGTGGENGGLLNAAFLPTDPIDYAARQAVQDFATRAQEFLNRNPNATAADISASATGYSRGTATAIA